MLTLDEIKTKLTEANLQAVAKAADVHPNTLYKLMNGARPSYDTVKKLSDYLEGKE